MSYLTSHGPEVLETILLLLTLGLLLMVLAALRRQEAWRVRWLCLLYTSLALTVGAGFPLIHPQPNERAANVACGAGAAMVAAGVLCAIWTAFGSEAARVSWKREGK